MSLWRDIKRGFGWGLGGRIGWELGGLIFGWIRRLGWMAWLALLGAGSLPFMGDLAGSSSAHQTMKGVSK